MVVVLCPVGHGDGHVFERDVADGVRRLVRLFQIRAAAGNECAVLAAGGDVDEAHIERGPNRRQNAGGVARLGGDPDRFGVTPPAARDVAGLDGDVAELGKAVRSGAERCGAV